MAESRQREAWGRTSTLLAMIANVARALGGKSGSGLLKPSDFDPFEQRKQAQAEPIPGSVRMLKDVFVKPQSKGV
jgi:hypothetical protein